MAGTLRRARVGPRRCVACRPCGELQPRRGRPVESPPGPSWTRSGRRRSGDEAAYVPDLVAAGFHRHPEPWWHESPAAQAPHPVHPPARSRADLPRSCGTAVPRLAPVRATRTGRRTPPPSARRRRRPGVGAALAWTTTASRSPWCGRSTTGCSAPTVSSTETTRNSRRPRLVTPRMTIPTLGPDQPPRRHVHPPVRPRGLPGSRRRRPRRRSTTRSRSATATSTPRRCTATSRRRRRHQGLRDRPRRALHHLQAEQRLPPARGRRRAFERVPGPSSASTRSTCSSSTGRCPREYDGDFVSTWRTLAEFVEDGRARSIGVSNFQPDHLDRIVEETGIVPVVNQIEVHPFFAQRGGARGQPPPRHPGRGLVARSPRALSSTTTRSVRSPPHTGKTPAQVALRWHIQRGDIIFPKSTQMERMRGELRRSSTSSSPSDADARHRARSTVARRAAPARTRTPSTTSPTDPARLIRPD